jgi:arylsulfatase A-like enzyme
MQPFPSRPNVVVIQCDQMRRDLIGLYGSTLCKTPTLDQFAQSAVTFMNAYTVTGICTPARASLLTGLYPHTHGMLNNAQQKVCSVKAELGDEFITYSQLFKNAGYQSAYVGKWHVGIQRDPTHYGFDRYIPTNCSRWNREKLRDLNVREECRLPYGVSYGGDPIRMYGTVDSVGKNGSLSDTDEVCEQSCNEIRRMAAESQRSGKPFHIRIDYEGPHGPNYIPPAYAQLYDPNTIPPWANWKDDFEGKPHFLKTLRRMWQVEGLGWDEWAKIVAMYMGEISQIDALFQKTLDVLKEHHLEENTIVVFTADHGDHTGSHGLYNKGIGAYDEVYRIPLLIRFPKGFGKGKRVQSYVRNMDVFATILEAAGIQSPQPHHAKSLIPLVQKDEGSSDVFYEYFGENWGLFVQKVIRNDEFKYVFNVTDTDELYDLKNDPYEMKNLIRDPQYAPVIQKLRNRLLQYMEQTQDSLLWNTKTIFQTETH